MYLCGKLLPAVRSLSYDLLPRHVMMHLRHFTIHNVCIVLQFQQVHSTTCWKKGFRYLTKYFLFNYVLLRQRLWKFLAINKISWKFRNALIRKARASLQQLLSLLAYLLQIIFGICHEDFAYRTNFCCQSNERGFKM